MNGKTVDRFPWYKNRVNELEAKATPEDPIVVEVDGNTMKFTNGIYYVPDQDASPSDYTPVLRVRETIMTGDMNRDDSDEVKANMRALLKRMVSTYGPIVIGFRGRDDGLYDKLDSNDKVVTSTYSNPQGLKTSWGHYVLLVGWDDNYPRTNFSSADIMAHPEKFPKANGAWLVQNSWGEEANEKGYLWITYEEPLNDMAAFIVSEPDEKIRHYGYDDLGWTNSFNPGKDNERTAYMASVFKVAGDYEKIVEAGLYLTDTIQSYDIYVYDLGESSGYTSPVKGDPIISEKREGIKQSGYYTHIFDKAVSIKKGHYFSVVVKMTVTQNNKYPLAVESDYEDKHANFQINAGESFFSVNGTNWTDGYSFESKDKSNACLKGFTSIPNEKYAEDWEIKRDGDVAELTIKLLLDSAPRECTVEGTGIEEIDTKLEADTKASTGGYEGMFYTLTVACVITDSDKAAITGITINGQYLNIPSEGVLLSDMTSVSTGGSVSSSSSGCNLGLSALTMLALGMGIFLTKCSSN
ncbi:MAG: hypothetical protein IJT58_09745 [Synergistaceae bacterium]|nr:hypothetical protein [Synergistaceae bacterium]